MTRLPGVDSKGPGLVTFCVQDVSGPILKMWMEPPQNEKENPRFACGEIPYCPSPTGSTRSPFGLGLGILVQNFFEELREVVPD